MTPIKQPPWCDPAHCDVSDDLPVVAGGAHRSTPVDVTLTLLLGDTVDVRLQLRQEIAGWPTPVVLAVQRPGDTQSALITPNSVRRMLAAAALLLSAAGEGSPLLDDEVLLMAEQRAIAALARDRAGATEPGE